MTKHVKNILPLLLSGNDSWKWTLLSGWHEIMGALHEQATLQKIEGETLIISVSNSCWLQELSLLRDTLKIRINQKLDRPYIKTLRFILQTRKKGPLSSKADISIKVEQNIILNQQENEQLAKIPDPELRQVLRMFLIRCYQERS